MADIAINWTGKIHGGNIYIKPTKTAGAIDLWVPWDWQWVEDQIDYGMSLGHNVFRVFGDVKMVFDGLITQSDYNTRWRQIAAYCALRGVGLYYTGCSMSDAVGNNNGTQAAMTNQQIADVIISNINALLTPVDYTTTLVGIDAVQEWNFSYTAARVNATYTILRAAIPSIFPITFSTYADPTDDASVSPVIASLDHLDFHLYPFALADTMPTPTQITNGPRTNRPTKEIMFGEAGSCSGNSISGSTYATYSANDVEAWVKGSATLGAMADAKVRGTLEFQIADMDYWFGAFDASWAPRTAVVRGWCQGWGTGSLVAPTAPVLVDGVLLWDAHAASDAFTATRLYRNGTQIASALNGRYAADVLTVQGVYQSSAMAGASESALSAYSAPLPSRNNAACRARGVQLTLR